MIEGEKNHTALTLTQERSNSPRRDIAHSFQSEGHRETSKETEYFGWPFANLLMSSWEFLFGLCKGRKTQP